MEDIAKRVGVSKGTLYLYVESKEALFDLALRYADRTDAFEEPTQLPVSTPKPGSTLDYISGRLASDERFRAFAQGLKTRKPRDAKKELEEVVRALYRALYDNRHAIKLVDTCAADHPQLAEMWFRAGRGGVTALLIPFLERRIAQACYTKVPDVPLAARFILESCMLWAVHINWDPHPELLRVEKIEDTLVQLVSRGILRSGG